MASLPADIRKHIIQPEATAQIERFQELFVLLNTDGEAAAAPLPCFKRHRSDKGYPRQFRA
jgi:hypothetical protein